LILGVTPKGQVEYLEKNTNEEMMTAKLTKHETMQTARILISAAFNRCDEINDSEESFMGIISHPP
jgi:hypothetical protein